MPRRVDHSKLYDPDFITVLFDEMSASYGITNYISSLAHRRGARSVLRLCETLRRLEAP